MNIVIKIMEGDKIIEHKSLSTEQKKEYGQKLNEQALAAAERSNGVLYAQAQEHFEKEQRDKNWITSFVAVPYNNLYDRLFRLAEEYGKIKAEVYIDKTITDTIYVKVSKV